MESESLLKIVTSERSYEAVPLVEPLSSYYIFLAAEIDYMYFPFPLWQSKRKKLVIQETKRLCQSLMKQEDVISAVVFNAAFIPPGRGAYLKYADVPVARYDVTLLIEVANLQKMENTIHSGPYKEIENLWNVNSRAIYKVTARNVKRIGNVNHSKPGVFLFNYFYAENITQNLLVWEYTAGWFHKETGLDNSTVLLPLDSEQSPYAIINHCRWDQLRDILPDLIFKRSFRQFVLANFYANKVAPMPILYRMI